MSQPCPSSRCPRLSLLIYILCIVFDTIQPWYLAAARNAIRRHQRDCACRHRLDRHRGRPADRICDSTGPRSARARAFYPAPWQSRVGCAVCMHQVSATAVVGARTFCSRDWVPATDGQRGAVSGRRWCETRGGPLVVRIECLCGACGARGGWRCSACARSEPLEQRALGRTCAGSAAAMVVDRRRVRTHPTQIAHRLQPSTHANQCGKRATRPHNGPPRRNPHTAESGRLPAGAFLHRIQRPSPSPMPPPLSRVARSIGDCQRLASKAGTT